jgi:altronate hydrolase
MIQETVTIKSYLKIHPADNVLVALRDIIACTTVLYEKEILIINDTINAKHKL